MSSNGTVLGLKMMGTVQSGFMRTVIRIEIMEGSTGIDLKSLMQYARLENKQGCLPRDFHRQGCDAL